MLLQTKRLIHIFPPKSSFIYTIETQFSNSSFSLLNLCSNPSHLHQIHARFILHGLHQNPTLCSKLMENYAKFGLFGLSQQVFFSCLEPNSTVYSSLICILYKFCDFKKTLFVYQEMVLKSMYPDQETYPYVLKSCFELLDIKIWEMIHVHVIKLGFDLYDLVGDVVVEMNRVINGSCSVSKAFEEKPVSVEFWNSLIFEASKNGDPKKSFQIFERMKMERVGLNSVTVINLLRATVDLRSPEVGKMLHSVVYMSKLCKDLAVNTALLSMYSKLGGLNVARLLFDKMPERDCVVWNVMISSYLHNGCPFESLELLMAMSRSGFRTDLFTALAAISSISELKYLKQGKEMHTHVIRNGSDYQVSVQNSLIDLYCKCGCLISAKKVFDLVTEKTNVSWSSIMKGFVSNEQFSAALSLFSKMKLDGYRIDFITMINILPACVSIGALEQVKYLHGYSVKCGLTSFQYVNTAFLASYAKCGCIDMARKLFDEEELNYKDVIAWNSMINAYSKHGDWIQCFGMYNLLIQQTNLKPDHFTFLGILTACVNSGSVKEGWECFKEMTDRYSCQPNQEHYACMVDLLGRAGRMKEALELIKSMPVNPDARVWGPLLSACKLHPDMKLAEFAAERLMEIEPKNAGNYVLLSNIYAAAGKWDGVSRIWTSLRDTGLKKTPGISWLEIKGKFHEFRVADQTHPKSDDIYSVLRNLELETKEVMTSKPENHSSETI